jgi:hypothetical protein
LTANSTKTDKTRDGSLLLVIRFFHQAGRPEQ